MGAPHMGAPYGPQIKKIFNFIKKMNLKPNLLGKTTNENLPYIDISNVKIIIDSWTAVVERLAG